VTDVTASALADALRDRYTLERELGRGGMATVYLAHDLRHDRDVALKVLRPDLAAVLGRERFLAEIRLTAKLDHPHILTLIDSGESNGLLWYVLPFIRGESLRQKLQREKQLSLDEALAIAKQIAGALEYAHQHGVIHRDLKPENILLHEGEAMLADFGIALAVKEAGGNRLTETGLSLGTPQYMSPEQATGNRQLDARSDVYSLGAVLYEMLAGEPPHTGVTAQAVIAKLMTERPTRLRTVRDAVPEAVDDAVARALAKVPADRFSTTAAFAHAISESLRSYKVPPLTIQRGPVSRLRRRGVVLIGVVLCIMLLLAGVAYYSRRTNYEGSSEPVMLAILPLKNMGAAADQYFADGLTEEITTRLASVGSIGVISRTSADRYRNSSKPLKTVGKELGANYVLEGSVRWERRANGQSRIRVTPQLIRVSDDRHLWADSYDADLSDVFQVQGSIAERVTRALNVALGEPQRRQLAARPTSNLSAYDAYLRGKALSPRDYDAGLDVITIALQRSVDQYREAIRLDSTFALAYAELGVALVMLTEFGGSATAAPAKEAIDQSLKLAPSLTDAHAALGRYHFVVDRDSISALRELQVAIAQRPNDADLLSTLAEVEWRTSGVTEQAVHHAEAAVRLDPQSPDKLSGLATLYLQAQRFDKAEPLYNRLIGLNPNSPGPYIGKAMIHLLRDGDTLGARLIIRSGAVRVDSMSLVTAAATNQSTWFALGLLDEPYQRALLALRPEAFGGDTAWFGLALGYTYRARGDSVRFHAYYDTAYAAADAQLRRRRINPLARSVQVWVLAGRGQRAEAYRAWAELRSSSGRQSQWVSREVEARLAVIAGDYDRALTLLAQGEWGPNLTIPWLCVDHFWDALRHDPRFYQLTKGECRAISQAR
jgi:serine/threonine protein kinase